MTISRSTKLATLVTKLPEGKTLVMFDYFPPSEDYPSHRFFIDDGRLTLALAEEWCERMAKGEYKVRCGLIGVPVFLTFENNQDAMAFKLAWQ